MRFRPSKQTDQSGRTAWFALALLVVVLALIGLVLNKQQAIGDWFKLRGYRPPNTITQLADQDGMNSYTRHLFYLNQPQLLSTVQSFRKYCPENKDTVVLGCYHSGQNGIYIYAVQDPTLAGVQQVTAAHEVLHAIYARLSTTQRSQLDGELEDFYKHDLHDPRVLAEVQLYQQTEPGAVMDEMSCTFGTELPQLPAPLEAYYRQYFSNRAVIVRYEQQYESAFTSRQATIAADDQQLASMKQQISSQQAVLQAELSQINSDRSHLDDLSSSGQVAAYNAAVPPFNTEVNNYNQGVSSWRALVGSYNQLVETRNQVAGQLTTLDSALDTRLTTQTTR